MLFAFAEQEKVVQVFRGGELVREFSESDIDYIEVNDRVETPSKIDSEVENKGISITWEAVEGATYNVYRSADKLSFDLIAEGLTENSYTDNAPLSGSNFYRVKAVIGGVESGYSSTVSAEYSDTDLPSGIYLGIDGFNQTLTELPVQRLTKRNYSEFNRFIEDLQMKDGTILYYSFDKALDALQSSTYPSDLNKVAIITFTDGLDRGSFMLNSDYEDETEYLDAMNHRITDEKVAGLPIEAYSIGIRGTDVRDIEMFRNNLSKLSSSPENVYEASSMYQVSSRFKEIADNLTKRSYLQTLKIKIPGLANGTRIRFTFDNRPPKSSNYYIEGVLNINNDCLENIVYYGVSSTSGDLLKGEREGIFFNFIFENVKTDPNLFISSSNTDEWIYDELNNSWQFNSEFDKNDEYEVNVLNSSAVIMLVVDCSNSLSTSFDNVKNSVKNFVSIMYNSVYADPTPGIIDENIRGFVDLGLPSGIKWAKCNEGADTPEEAGKYISYSAIGTSWGDNWRIPNDEEMRELVNECEWIWTDNINRHGYLVIGPNGKSIFIPAAGYYEYFGYYNWYLRHVNTRGKYLIKQRFLDGICEGCLSFSSESISIFSNMNSQERYSIRLVKD